ncbi:uncharacterized protein LOC132622206 [Lycium barbarum]|uniref:uncharacterized protein LOC132622206 n=1 Tax=Lycium barbarum TaxID=112863 RepID=UPI00293ECE11|nr:uncharacterized protein LOC132622206 [Lycium barbarum]
MPPAATALYISFLLLPIPPNTNLYYSISKDYKGFFGVMQWRWLIDFFNYTMEGQKCCIYFKGWFLLYYIYINKIFIAGDAFDGINLALFLRQIYEITRAAMTNWSGY